MSEYREWCYMSMTGQALCGKDTDALTLWRRLTICPDCRLLLRQESTLN